ncbi:unnamed protein product [Symbiodinium necroappetens]|uniref:Uncharacterized protein n=1 Tax=Symbiodinium necroappetens TaxID=1628268 RepID=A0A813CDR2_9DINO|nr:unnamed protein product [Symbiodinium necroappetens]
MAFALTLERHNSPNQYEARFPQIDLSIAAGRAEVTTRAVVVITDKSFTSPMPTHRGHPPPPPPPSGQGATGGQAGAAAPGSPSSFSMVTGPDAARTPAAALETPAPTTPPGGAAPPGPSTPPEAAPDTTPPRMTLSSSKKARVSEESVERARGSQDPAPMDVARGLEEPVERPIAPPAPPPTRLALRNMAKAGAAAKAKTSPKASHRLPPRVSWDDL